MKKIIAISLIVLALIVASFFFGKHKGKQAITREISVQIDTLIVRDTITVEKPKIVERMRVDKEYIEVRDTIRILDTLYMLAERESITSKTDSFKVVASGINPSIDLVEVYQKTQYIDRVDYIPKKTRWGIGVQVGYGVTVNKSPIFSPYIGLGVSYNLISF